MLIFNILCSISGIRIRVCVFLCRWSFRPYANYIRIRHVRSKLLRISNLNLVTKLLFLSHTNKENTLRVEVCSGVSAILCSSQACCFVLRTDNELFLLNAFIRWPGRFLPFEKLDRTGNSLHGVWYSSSIVRHVRNFRSFRPRDSIEYVLACIVRHVRNNRSFKHRETRSCAYRLAQLIAYIVFVRCFGDFVRIFVVPLSSCRAIRSVLPVLPDTRPTSECRSSR